MCSIMCSQRPGSFIAFPKKNLIDWKSHFCMALFSESCTAHMPVNRDSQFNTENCARMDTIPSQSPVRSQEEQRRKENPWGNMGCYFYRRVLIAQEWTSSSVGLKSSLISLQQEMQQGRPWAKLSTWCLLLLWVSGVASLGLTTTRSVLKLLTEVQPAENSAWFVFGQGLIEVCHFPP